MKKREAFDQAAKIYDESRPSYPDETIDWIINQTNVSQEKRLLEIGAGTGQCTIKFAERGYPIHCVEMGKNLADLLAKKTEKFDVTIDVNSFEEWQPQNDFKTPLIFCATAFHWLDPNIKYKKCYDLLENDGYLVLLWNVACDVDIKEVKTAYQLLFAHYPKQKTKKEIDIKKFREQEINDSGYFTLFNSIVYSWKLKNTKEQFINGFFSQSSYLALDAKKKDKLHQQVLDLFKNLDDVIETEFNTMVFVAKKV